MIRAEPGQTLLVVRESRHFLLTLASTNMPLVLRFGRGLQPEARTQARPKLLAQLVSLVRIGVGNCRYGPAADVERRAATDEFKARTEDELSMTKGDRVQLIERDDGFDDGWYLGRHCGTGVTGLFPQGSLLLDARRLIARPEESLS